MHGPEPMKAGTFQQHVSSGGFSALLDVWYIHGIWHNTLGRSGQDMLFEVKEECRHIS